MHPAPSWDYVESGCFVLDRSIQHQLRNEHWPVVQPLELCGSDLHVMLIDLEVHYQDCEAVDSFQKVGIQMK